MWCNRSSTLNGAWNVQDTSSAGRSEHTRAFRALQLLRDRRNVFLPVFSPDMYVNEVKRKVVDINPQSQPPITEAELRGFIKNFSFDNCERGNQGFRRLLLQLFGYAGHGKSSLINTCKMVWENSTFKNYTRASGSYGGDTMDRRTYDLTENIILVDNRGCSTMRSYEQGEIFAQLANLIPLDTKVDWSPGFQLSDRIVKSEHLVNSSDFISPILVYSVGYLPNPNEFKELKEILGTCREMTGVEATIVLTHKKKGNVKRLEAMFRDLGVQNMFSLENYTPNNQSKSTEVHNSVMRFLYEVVKDAEFRASYLRNPQEEMAGRKRFVLNYIHCREVEAHRRKLEAQKAAEDASIELAIRIQREKAEKEKIEEVRAHRERVRELEERFQRQRLYEQYEHEQKMKERQQRGRST